MNAIVHKNECYLIVKFWGRMSHVNESQEERYPGYD